MPNLRREFFQAFQRPLTENGFGKTRADFGKSVKLETAAKKKAKIGPGSVLIAAQLPVAPTPRIRVSCLPRALLAKKAVEEGSQGQPGGQGVAGAGFTTVVTDYLKKTGLQPYLNKLRFNLVGYGCTTCIGNAGPLDPEHRGSCRQARHRRGESVLSGNRNFEARVHQNIKANFLMSPPLVVAFALAGRVDIDLSCEPLGTGKGTGTPVYLADLWPTFAGNP